MGILTAKYEKRIHELEMQVDDLTHQLAGERAMRRYEVAERDERIARMMQMAAARQSPISSFRRSSPSIRSSSKRTCTFKTPSRASRLSDASR